MSTAPRAIEALLFDIDGTLIDSNLAHAESWVEACAQKSVTIAVDHVLPLIGMGGDKVIAELTGLDSEHPIARDITARRNAIFSECFLEHLQPFPDAHELLADLRSRGLRLSVATSASRKDATSLLRQAGLAEFFERSTTSDDAEESKPDPDIVLAALRRAAVPAGSALMIGDTPYDVEAATRAGVGCLAFRCGGWTDDGLAGAIAVYDGPADLRAHLDSEPIASLMRPD